MNRTLMLLPAGKKDDIRLLQIPDDYEDHEPYRQVTGLIAAVEEEKPEYECEDNESMHDDKVFVTLDLILSQSQH